jgi:cytochrome oxidase Cu insertion factor (SCO1/SenC/PrrC family)
MFSRMAAPRRGPRRHAAMTLSVIVAMMVAVAAIGLSGGSADSLSPADLDPLLRAFSVRPWWGDPPRLSLAALDGQRHSSDSLHGRVALLYFWATW